MNILVIGSGGREHALCWALKQSPQCDTLFCAPGNAGIADVAECVVLDVNNAEAVISFCQLNGIGLVVVGPEAPLVAGLVDALDTAGIKAFGPSQAAAQLEGSKAFTKVLCDEANIPTAAYGQFDNEADALAYVQAQGAPIVIKADGLAAGKGVVVAMTLAEAEDAVRACFDGAFGDAGASVVVEEFLEGEEASLFALSDGTHAQLFGTAQDHKRVGEGDTGPNTGGMGAYSPAPVMTDALVEETMRTIIQPTVDTLKQRGTPYKGVLYAGLMITKDGPKLIEYNVRFGDPECQVLMMRLTSDLVTHMLASVDGTLDSHPPKWSPDPALTIVMASIGYPGSYEKNTVIEGVDQAASTGAQVFHAGTGRQSGALVATGGRVLNVTATGQSVSQAQKKAYDAVDQIKWDNGFCRRDIGWRAIEREQSPN